MIFIHGYSVSSIETYGELAPRLQQEAELRGVPVQAEDIYLARYISFNDQVRLEDLASALEAALADTIYPRYPKQRFVCITHSTGGPLVRTWHRTFFRSAETCPMSHLVMLAPANHGSALAQLGKSRVSRVKSWFNGVEPGQRVLDWLELGSRGSWRLNKSEIAESGPRAGKGIFYFVLTGQDIDRKFYDHINSYTGEPGSDGVVRVASANLNSSWLRIVQSSGDLKQLHIKEYENSDTVPLRILKGKSHSNEDMGIMRSVRNPVTDKKNADTLDAIMRCISVSTAAEYDSIRSAFEEETREVQLSSRLEKENRLTGDRYYIHDRHSMIIFRVRDSEGHVVQDYDLLLTSGARSDPDDLPPGFFRDRQCNCKDKTTLTYYLNYDIMNGCEAVVDSEGKIRRPQQPGARSLGITIIPRPDKGFVRYATASLKASADNFEKLLKPNATTLVEIVLQRLVSTEILRLTKLGEGKNDWRDAEPGDSFIT